MKKLTKKVAKEIIMNVVGNDERLVSIYVNDEDNYCEAILVDNFANAVEVKLLYNLCYISRQSLSSLMVCKHHDYSNCIDWSLYK